MSDGTPLRDKQQALTRAAIIEAFLDLSHAENAVSISVPAVARRAGVSVRTVYRYFGTKDQLQTEAAHHYSDRAAEAADTGEVTGENFHEYLARLWTDFSDVLPAVYAEHSTPAGRELRATRLKHFRAMLAESLQPYVGDDPSAELIDLVVAIASSSMYLELVDRMGHPPEKAASLAAHVIQLLVADAADSPSPTSSSSPPENTP